MTRSPICAAVIAGLAASLIAPAAVAATGDSGLPNVDWNICRTMDESGRADLDPKCFFDMLVARYRGLTMYQDVARVTQVTQRDGERTQRVVTRIGCEIEGGKLRVDTPASRVGRGIGLGSVKPATPELEQALLQYNIWLAPHMALKYATSPEAEFRTGVPEGFTATAVNVTEGDKPMVHLELRSGDGKTDEPDAQFDIYVNPDSLLIERIEGQERMPGGGSYETTLEITPLSVTESEIVAEPAPYEPEPHGPMTVDGPSVTPDTAPVPAPVPVPPTRNPAPVRPQ